MSEIEFDTMNFASLLCFPGLYSRRDRTSCTSLLHYNTAAPRLPGKASPNMQLTAIFAATMALQLVTASKHKPKPTPPPPPPSDPLIAGCFNCNIVVISPCGYDGITQRDVPATLVTRKREAVDAVATAASLELNHMTADAPLPTPNGEQCVMPEATATAE
jgi:hypothetical protein